jgi:hypothetical protein
VLFRSVAKVESIEDAYINSTHGTNKADPVAFDVHMAGGVVVSGIEIDLDFLSQTVGSD